MRFTPRRSRAPLYLALFVLLVVLLIWAVVERGRPEVIDVFPAEDAFAVPAPAPVRLAFDRPMNASSVEDAFRSVPARGGTFTWEENAVSFIPDEAWPRGASITVTLSTSARTSAGIRLGEEYSWSFRTAPTMLAYLWPAGGSQADLYALDPATGDITRLTDSDYGVFDFAPGPDGLHILLSAGNRFGGADIAELDLLTGDITILQDCRGDLCIRPVYSPVSGFVAFENSTEGQVFVLGADGEVAFSALGRSPQWSPLGVLLGYNPAIEAYFTFDPQTREQTEHPNSAGEPAGWYAGGNAFLAPEIVPIGAGSFASHLGRYSLSGGRMADISAQALADDNAPAVSPNGAWLAFARRWLAPERWTPGRQLWVMTADGEDAVQLTANPLYNHTALAWHPDSVQIAYVRSNQADLNEPPEIWLTGIDGRAPLRLVIDGFAPQWLP